MICVAACSYCGSNLTCTPQTLQTPNLMCTPQTPQTPTPCTPQTLSSLACGPCACNFFCSVANQPRADKARLCPLTTDQVSQPSSRAWGTLAEIKPHASMIVPGAQGGRLGTRDSDIHASKMCTARRSISPFQSVKLSANCARQNSLAIVFRYHILSGEASCNARSILLLYIRRVLADVR